MILQVKKVFLDNIKDYCKEADGGALGDGPPQFCPTERAVGNDDFCFLGCWGVASDVQLETKIRESYFLI